MRLLGLDVTPLLMAFALVALSVVPAVSQQTIALYKKPKQRFLSYYANAKIKTPECGQYQHLIVVVHGAGREPEASLEAVSLATQEKASSTLIVAPWFPQKEDLIRVSLSTKSTFYWQSEDWKWGGLAESRDKNYQVSSFEVLEDFISVITKRCRSVNKLTIAGHSAGGQFVQRFSAFHRISARSYSQGIHHIVANPSSYLYFNSVRPVLNASGLIEFAQPSAEFQNSCSSYNSYRFGLKRIPKYLSFASKTQMIKRYAARKITFLLGEEDTSEVDPSLDISCGALIQGKNRFLRGQYYFSYLQEYFGAATSRHHALYKISGVGHSASQMFKSSYGKIALLE